jgi:hypothetical protein
MITVSRDHWVERARQCRAFAASQSNDVVASRMLDFARSYDALAAGFASDDSQSCFDGWLRGAGVASGMLAPRTSVGA